MPFANTFKNKLTFLENTFTTNSSGTFAGLKLLLLYNGKKYKIHNLWTMNIAQVVYVIYIWQLHTFLNTGPIAQSVVSPTADPVRSRPGPILSWRLK